MIKHSLVEQKMEYAKTFLTEILSTRINGVAHIWLDRVFGELQGPTKERALYMSFSAASRYTTKDKMELKEDEKSEASSILKHWNLSEWTVEQSLRTLLILMLSVKEAEEFKKILNKLFTAADVAELIALYSALPLFPFAESFTDRASEGIRNNITPVFDAVALHNPYPSKYLSEDAWNQLVLKAIFNNRPVNKIVGLDERTNPALASMLCDFAHERWAAGRTVVPQLWRCVGPYIHLGNIADIKRILKSESYFEQAAGALACSQSNFPEAIFLLDQYPALKSKITDGLLSWDILAHELEAAG